MYYNKNVVCKYGIKERKKNSVLNYFTRYSLFDIDVIRLDVVFILIMF